jgi:hypothetical protein
MSAQNIEVYQGEDLLVSVTVTDANGNAQDLTGYDIRYEANTPTPIVKDRDHGEIIVTAPATGVFTFTIAAADTSGLKISGRRAFSHECRVESPDGEVSVVFTGKLVITEGLIEEMDPAM